jgi:hypothetical protein
MAVIKYDELFDFPGYNKAIKDAEAANTSFGKVVTDINNRIAKQYAELKAEVEQYTGVLKSFNVNQKGAGDSIIRTGDAAVSASKKMQEQKNTMQALLDTSDLLTLSNKELKTALAGALNELNGLGGKSESARAKVSALQQEVRRLKSALKEQADATKVTTKVMEAAEGSYQSFQNELVAIGKQLKNIPDAFDRVTGKINANNAAAVNLSKRYVEVNGMLKNADASLGNYQRNVGNYSSAFNGLGNSVNQLSRELPALAINAQTFFLAISNNLPILFDQLGQTKREIAALKAEGKAAPTVFQQLGKAIFSLGTLLSVGITLLTLFGAQIIKFVGDLFKGKKAFSEAAESAKLMNKAIEETDYKEAIKNVNELTINIDLAKKGFLNKKDVLKQYNETIGKVTGEVKSLDEAEQALNKNANNYIKFTLLKAAANLALGQAAKAAVDEIKNDLENKDEITKERADLFPEIPKDARERYMKLRRIYVRDIQAATLNGDKELAKAIEKQRTELEDDFNNKFFTNKFKKEKEGYLNVAKKLQADAASAAKEFGFNFFDPEKTTNKKDKGDTFADKIKRQQELLESAAQKRISLFELANSQELVSENEFQAEKLAIIQKYVLAAIELENLKGKNADQKVIDELNKKSIDAAKEYQEFLNKSSLEGLEKRKQAIQDEAELRVSGLKDEQVEVLSSKKFTDNQRLALEIDYQNKIDRILIDALDARIKLEVDAAKKAALEREKAALERGIKSRGTDFDEKTLNSEYKARVDAENKSLALIAAGRDLSFRDQMEHLKRLEQIEKEFAQKGVDITKDAEERKYQEKVLAAERERALRQEIEATIIEGINAGLQIAQNLSDGKFQERIAKLEAEKKHELELAGNNAAAKEKIEAAFAKKIAEQKRKQAIADRNFALFNVAINTAQGVAKSIAQWGMPFAIPFIALTLVSGALQAAVIASRPLPQFRYGTDNSPEGFAIVDEDGPELIIDKHGRLKEVGQSGGARTTYLEKGSTVLPAGKTRDILRESNYINNATNDFSKGRSIELAYAIATNANHINEARITEGFRKAVKDIPIQQWISDEKGQRLREVTVNNKNTYLNNLTKL